MFVLSRSNWGTFVTSAGTVAGKDGAASDWQLYLMSKKDMASPQMIPLMELSGQHSRQTKTALSTVLSNPAELYRYLLSRRCPHVFEVRPTAVEAAHADGLHAAPREEYRLLIRQNARTSSQHKTKSKRKHRNSFNL